MPNDFHKKLGERISQLRTAMNISAEELGFRAEISGSYISLIEAGKRDMKISKLEKIAKGLKVSLKDLLDF